MFQLNLKTNTILRGRASLKGCRTLQFLIRCYQRPNQPLHLNAAHLIKTTVSHASRSRGQENNAVPWGMDTAT